MASTEEHVSAVFKALLGRLPESRTAIDTHVMAQDLEALILSISGSLEYQLRTRPGPLWNYTAIFDPIPLILKYEKPDRTPVEGHRVNYLGVAVNVDRFFQALKLANGLEPVPIPSNWHTDIAELSAVLRAVDQAGDEFSMVELGCGWGCWMNISGAAARLAGKRPFLIGIEGDEGHVQFAYEAMATNGFEESQYKLFRGIVAARSGKVFFPRQDTAGASWGLEPIFHPDAEKATELRESGAFDELDAIPLAEVMAERNRIDLLHIDIQGGEAGLIRETLPLLKEKVAYLTIGTHSRLIDGAIIDILGGDGGWSLEIERPTVFTIHNDQLITQIDGVQGWRNKAFKVIA
ncbi:MAG: class I SAM-dependent methyltransferase [Ancalomicrobiaceae bacterium]|nr:class I SAM-dependent methyltransferase [Ancalomicrobiaceae bacterium]